MIGCVCTKLASLPKPGGRFLVRTLSVDVVATKLCIIIGANVVRALHVLHARADVVATKLGIILSSFFLLLSSFHVLFSQKGFA